MFPTTSAISSICIFLVVGCPGSVDDDDAGTDPGDAGAPDAGFVDPCTITLPPFDRCGACDDAVMFTNEDVAAFAAADHSAPLREIILDGENGGLTDLSPLENIFFEASRIDVLDTDAPSFVLNGATTFSLILNNNQAMEEIRLGAVRQMGSLFVENNGSLHSLEIPALLDLDSARILGNSALCQIDLGASQASDVCMLDGINGNCDGGELEIASCCDGIAD